MTGRSQEAIAQFQQGVGLDPSDADAQLNLAVALAAAGRKADARMHAQAALRLEPDNARARQLLKSVK
jgi:Flp pilus assembly protein TadD